MTTETRELLTEGKKWCVKARTILNKVGAPKTARWEMAERDKEVRKQLKRLEKAEKEHGTPLPNVETALALAGVYRDLMADAGASAAQKDRDEVKKASHALIALTARVERAVLAYDDRRDDDAFIAEQTLRLDGIDRQAAEKRLKAELEFQRKAIAKTEAIEVWLRETDGLLGAAELRASTKTTYDAASALAEAGDWEGAFKKVEGVDVGALRKQAQNANRDALAAKKGDPALADAVDRAQAALTALDEVASPSEVTPLRLKFQMLRAALFRDPANPNAADIAAMDALKTELETKKRTLVTERDHALARKLSFDTDLARLHTILPAVDYVPLMKISDRADYAVSACDWPAAEAVYDELKAECERVWAPREEPYAKWDGGVRAQLEASEARYYEVSKAFHAAGLSPSLARLDEVFEDVRGRLRAGNNPRFDYVAAVTNWDAAAVDGKFDAADGLLAKLGPEAGEREQLRAEATRVRGEAEKAIDALPADAFPNDDVIGGLRSELPPVGFGSPPTLEEMRRALAERRTLCEDIVARAKAAGTRAADPARGEYLAARKELLGKIAQLADHGGAAGGKLPEFRSRADALNDEFASLDAKGGDLGGPRDAARALAAEVQARLDHVEGKRRELLAEVEAQKTLVQRRFDQLVAEVNANLGKKAADFQPFADGVAAEIADLSLMAGSNSHEALRACIDGFGELLGRLQSVTADAGTAQGFGGVLTRHKELKAQLDGSAMKTVAATAYAKLTKALDATKTAALSMGPAEGLAALDEFRTVELEPAIAKATDAVGYRATFEQKNTAAKLALKQLKARKDAPKLYAALEAKRQTAKTQAKTEGQEQAGIRTAEAVQAKAAEAARDPAVRSEAEGKLAREEFEKEGKLREFNIRMSDFEKGLYKRACKAVDDAVEKDPSLKGELDRMIEQCKKEANAFDFASANTHLKFAQEHAEGIIENPQGQKVTSKKNLPHMRDAWISAVATFHAELDKLKKEITPATKGDQEKRVKAAATKAVGEIEGLKKLLRPNAFSAHIALLAGDATDDAKRKSREAAMKIVREYDNRLQKGPLLLKLAKKNPLVATVPKAVASLKTVLADVEVNLQRCL